MSLNVFFKASFRFKLDNNSSVASAIAINFNSLFTRDFCSCSNCFFWVFNWLTISLSSLFAISFFFKTWSKSNIESWIAKLEIVKLFSINWSVFWNHGEPININWLLSSIFSNWPLNFKLLFELFEMMVNFLVLISAILVKDGNSIVHELLK